MGLPLAYLFTWTCYGTWLHGDERGSVDFRHNVYGTPVLAEDLRRYERASYALQSEPMYLNDAMRELVAAALVQHAEFRGWKLAAQNVRTNHVHCVVGATSWPAGKMLGSFKARATAVLREAGFVADQPVWTEGGSRRWLWDELSVYRACHYVLYGQ
jgi:hypothetical protein